MRQRYHAALTLDPLHDNARRAPVYRLFERAHVVGGNETNSRKQRLEIRAVLGLTGHRKSTEGAAVEGIVQRHDLVFLWIDFVPVRPNHLQSAFHGFGAAVAEKRTLQPA